MWTAGTGARQRASSAQRQTGRVAGARGQIKESGGIAERGTILLVEGGAEGLGIGGGVEGAGAAGEEVPHHQRPLEHHPLLCPKPLQRRNCAPSHRLASQMQITGHVQVAAINFWCKSHDHYITIT